MEKISTLSQLISVFDNQMLIFPDKRGISHFLKIVKHIHEGATTRRLYQFCQTYSSTYCSRCR